MPNNKPSMKDTKAIIQHSKTEQNPKGAGRPTGRKNSDKKSLKDRIQKLAFEYWGIEEWTPFDYAVKVASAPIHEIPMVGKDGKELVDDDGKVVKERIDPAFKLQCSKFIAEFTFPKLKSIEITPGSMGGRFKVNLRVNVEGRRNPLTPEQQEAIDMLDEATE